MKGVAEQSQEDILGAVPVATAPPTHSLHLVLSSLLYSTQLGISWSSGWHELLDPVE